MGKKETVVFYGWIILVVAFVTVAISNGIRFSFSVFYIEILREFGWSRADTALAFSFGMLVHALTAPLAGTLIDRFGPKAVLTLGTLVLTLGLAGMSQMHEIWQFYLLFGIVMSSAICILSPVSHAAFVYGWFTRRRGLAFSLLTAGGGLGFTLAPAVETAISRWGWRETCLILAVGALIIIVPLALVFQRRSPRQVQLLPGGAAPVRQAGGTDAIAPEGLATQGRSSPHDWTLAKTVATRPFWILIVATFLWSADLSLVQVHQIAQVTDAGYSALFAASVFGLFGVANAVGRFAAFVSDRVGIEQTAIVAAVGAMIGASALMLVHDTSAPWLLYFYAVFFGVFIGMLAPLNFAATADIYPSRNFGTIVGFMGTGWGVGSAVGAWFGGYVFDTTGSYMPALAVGNVGLVLCGLAFWLAAPRRARSAIAARV